MSETKNKRNIVFYDGECGFCHSTVSFILKRRKTAFYFIPLQSKKAREMLNAHQIIPDLSTVYYLRENRLYERSSAAMQIAKGLKGLYPLMIIFYVIPPFIRNAVYSGIARRRHKLRKGYCYLPKAEERKFFLDE